MENFYIRFTDNIKKDVENGSSVHNTGLDGGSRELKEDEVLIDGFICEKLGGHCAFDLSEIIEDESIESIEELIEEVRSGYKQTEAYNTDSFGSDWVILKGRYIEDCPEGDIIDIEEIIHIEYK